MTSTPRCHQDNIDIRGWKYLINQTVANFIFNNKLIDECIANTLVSYFYVNDSGLRKTQHEYIKDKSTRVTIASKT